MERRNEVEQGEDARTSSMRGMASYPRELIEFSLVVGRTLPSFRDRYHRAGIRKRGVLDEASGQLLDEHGVGLFVDDGFGTMWSGSDGWASRWDGKS